jgi:4-hydroxy-4-methyl-2-oxoglutarate aldolase
MPSTDQTAATLVHLGVATLHEGSGRRNLLSQVSLIVGPPFAGQAHTVALPAGDNLGLHVALETAPPSSVVCAASTGQGLYGVAGELLIESARARGVTALVIDDGIRDLDHLVAPPAIAARGISARGTVKRRVRQAVGDPVALGGVLIEPGDWVVCDRDGTLVIPQGHLEEVVERSSERVVKETEIRELLAAGKSSRQLYDLSDTPPVSIS